MFIGHYGVSFAAKPVAPRVPLWVWFIAAWLYARTVTLSQPFVFWGFVLLLAAMQVYANFGPPPASTTAMAFMALAFYVVLASLTALVERVSVETR